MTFGNKYLKSFPVVWKKWFNLQSEIIKVLFRSIVRNISCGTTSVTWYNGKPRKIFPSIKKGETQSSNRQRRLVENIDSLLVLHIWKDICSLPWHQIGVGFIRFYLLRHIKYSASFSYYTIRLNGISSYCLKCLWLTGTFIVWNLSFSYHFSIIRWLWRRTVFVDLINELSVKKGPLS
jgi:hypothetical protein